MSQNCFDTPSIHYNPANEYQIPLTCPALHNPIPLHILFVVAAAAQNSQTLAYNLDSSLLSVLSQVSAQRSFISGIFLLISKSGFCVSPPCSLSICIKPIINRTSLQWNFLIKIYQYNIIPRGQKLFCSMLYLQWLGLCLTYCGYSTNIYNSHSE